MLSQQAFIFATMKKVLAFVVLLSHINFGMFIPQVDELDMYDGNGQQMDDINSLFEYLDYVVIGNKDDSPQDEDDDTARYFSMAKLTNYSFCQQIIERRKDYSAASQKKTYPLYIIPGLNSRNDDIVSPPPEI